MSGNPRPVSRSSRVVNFALVAAIALAFIASLSTLQFARANKVDCYPIEGATKEKCESLGCVWSPVEGHPGRRVDEPWCFHPDDYMGYDIVPQGVNIWTLKRRRPSFMGPQEDVQNLRLKVGPHKSGMRLTIGDAERQRFVPELPKIEQDLGDASAASQAFIAKTELSSTGSQRLVIVRKESGAVVFAYDIMKLIFADKFLQINIQLSSPNVFGLGEHLSPFLKKAANDYQVYSFWNTDRLPLPGGTRSYGGFPFLINLAYENNSQTAYGIYLRNSNAMDVVLQKDQSVTFRPIGGVLDFFMLPGPEPLDVVRQFQQLVGLPELPARWGLGFHLCRYNYNSLERTKLVWARTRAAGIPFDVQWNDVDALERFNDFSVNRDNYTGLPEFVDQLHALNMHYIPLVDPGISQEPDYWPYALGSQMDVWIKNASGQPLVGRVWNKSGRTVFPDFSLPASHEFWKQMFVDYQKLIKFDGAWIDMNDISNFADGSLDGCPWTSALERPPYQPGGYGLQVHSLCLSAQHSRGSEYDMHNLYSSYEAIATKAALQAARPGRRSVIISRSSHPGQGAHSGHWNGDLQATWDYLRWSIPSLLEHSMYGFTLMGSDICGFSGNTTVQLCARWSTLGAFYTFSRNHNDDTSIDQDPVALGPEVVAANKNALTKRYSLLPYLYTLVYRAHKRGEPVARSLLFEFFSQKDAQLLEVEDQFMWGSGVMISPIVQENTYHKTSYLPAGRWYETNILPESMSFDANTARVPTLVDAEYAASSSLFTSANVTLANMPIFYRGGHIIPIYAQVKATIADTERDQPLALEIALCRRGRAKGEVYLDDGESVEDITSYVQMRAQDNTLSISLEKDNYMKEVKFGGIKVLGIQGKIKQVALGGPDAKTLAFEQKDHMLIFSLENTPAAVESRPVVVSWS